MAKAADNLEARLRVADREVNEKYEDYMAASRRRREVFEEASATRSQTEIGAIVGKSKQRVQQILNRQTPKR